MSVGREKLIPRRYQVIFIILLFGVAIASLLAGGAQAARLSQQATISSGSQISHNSNNQPRVPDAFMELSPESGAPPNGGTVNVGDRFVLDLLLNSGSNTDSTAQQSYITFTSGLLQNARVDQIANQCVPTNTITADLTIFDAALQNEVCNGPNPCLFRGLSVTPGTFSFASGALSNCPEGCGGTFRVARVGFCAIAPGQAVIHWQFSPPAPFKRDSQIISFDGDIISNRTLYADYVINIAGATFTPQATQTPTDTPIPPTSTDTPTSTATDTPLLITSTPTPTCSSQQAGWVAGASFPSNIVRGSGVFFPGNSRFYVIGGRSSDTAGSDLLNPREYNPATNVWTTKSGTFNNNQVNNMAAVVLNQAGTDYIFTVGGSAANATTSTNEVRRYDPVGDIITLVGTDPWPAPANTLPGGYAVFNNKLYILGGFTINASMSQQIWEFDPNRPSGSMWAQKNALVPDPVAGSNGMGYIPAAVIGNFIYTGGGSLWQTAGATIADSAVTFRYDPVNDVVDNAAVPDLPSPGRGETRAVNEGGKLWVIGGGRTTPNPSASVLQFDPANPGAGWTTVNSFTTARRNLALDIDPATGSIYLVGGYAPTNPTGTMQIYRVAGIPCTPTFTVTTTATNTTGPTNTPSNTPTCVPGSVDNNIQNFAFNPQNMTIYVGDSVNWMNLDPDLHTSTSDTGVWDSGNINTSESFVFTFNAPGTYPYFCTIHRSMTGTVTVLAGCPPPTVTETPTPVLGTPTGTPCGPSSIYWEAEPNDTVATAMRLGNKARSEIRGGVTTVGDVDYYSFEGTAGDRMWIYVNTSGALPSNDSELTLFDTNGTTIIQYDDDGGSQAPNSSGIAGAYLPRNGIYYIKVAARGGSSAVNPYTVYIDRTALSAIPEAEPNGTTATANPYTIGNIESGTVSTTNDNDYFSFAWNTGEQVTFQLDGDPERDGVQFFGRLRITNAANQTLADINSGSTNNGGLLSQSGTFTLTGASGTYFLRVTSLSGTTGTYTLHAFRAGTVSCGPTWTSTSTNTPTFTNTPTNTPVCQVQSASNDVPQEIADLGTAISSLTFSGVDTISQIRLTGLNVTHSYIGDLIVTLTSPSGTSVVLINRVCNAARFQDLNNINLADNAATAIGSACPPAANATYRPTNPLSAFVGQSGNGVWTLTISDNAAQDFGTLNGWGLSLSSNGPCVTITPSNTPTVTPTPTDTDTPGPTDTPTDTATSTATDTPMSTPTVTDTATNTPTNTNTSTFTNTPTNTATFTPSNTPTITPTPTCGASHYFMPEAGAPGNGGNAFVGDRFVLDMMVRPGPFTVTAQQAYLTFTYQLLQNVNLAQPGCVPTSTVTGDFTIFDVALQNEVCNGPNPCVFRQITVEPGSIAWASGALSNPSYSGPDFRVAQLAFCATAPGTARLHWEFHPPAPTSRDTEIVDINSNVVSTAFCYVDYVINILPVPTITSTSTSTSTQTNTATPTSTATFTNTSVPTETRTNTATPTNTSTLMPTNTGTNTATFTNTPTNTATLANTSTSTNTPVSTNTSTRTPSYTPINTYTRTSTPTSTFTDTATSTFTPTSMPSSTSTFTGTPILTNTSTLTRTNTPSSTPTNTPTETSTRTGTVVPASRTMTPILTETSIPPTHTFTATRTNTLIPTSTFTYTGTNTRTRTSTVAPATNTHTRTATPQVTGTPCDECNIKFEKPGRHRDAVELYCNPDGTLHWTASLLNKPDRDEDPGCTLVVPYRVSLQVKCQGGGPHGCTNEERGDGWRVVAVQRGTAQLPARQLVTFEGDFCYTWPSNADKMRVEFALDSHRHGCNKKKKSHDIRPCPTNPTCPPSAPLFPDVPSDYVFASPIQQLADTGIVSGFGDGTFRPNAPINRGQVAKMVVIANGITNANGEGGTEQHFTDVPTDHPYYSYIQAAYSQGLVGGYADGTYRPYDNVTRGQIAKIVVQAQYLELVTPDMPTFSDVAKDNVFYSYIETAYAHGILSGYADGTFGPNDTATRGQVSKIVSNVLFENE